MQPTAQEFQNPANSIAGSCPFEQLPLFTFEQLPGFNGWLLLEDSGPWSHRNSLGSEELPDEVVIAARSRRIRINPLRRRRQLFRSNSPRCFLAGSDVIEEWLPADLYQQLPQAFDAITTGKPTGGGVPVRGPIYLVCTNGMKNPACGRRAQKVLKAFRAAVGTRAWETAHVGGCKLAVNVVCLPTGVYYSNVTADDIPAIVAATEDGQICLDRYRGRGGLPTYLQAAELAVRRKTGIDSLNGVRPVAAERGVRETGLVRVNTSQGLYEVVMRRNEVVQLNAI